EDYEFAEWRLARVSTDYHVEFDRFFYSVPHRNLCPIGLLNRTSAIDSFS
ncbi:Mu transposase domain-containing protein, partial [Bradyrhizobium sp. SBR1B]|nr:hypothetical protein [Bradyrhizobium sp. SBR1B]